MGKLTPGNSVKEAKDEERGLGGLAGGTLPLGQGLWEIYQTQKLRDHLQMGRVQMPVGAGTPATRSSMGGRNEPNLHTNVSSSDPTWWVLLISLCVCACTSRIICNECVSLHVQVCACMGTCVSRMKVDNRCPPQSLATFCFCLWRFFGSQSLTGSGIHQFSYPGRPASPRNPSIFTGIPGANSQA